MFVHGLKYNPSRNYVEAVIVASCTHTDDDCEIGSCDIVERYLLTFAKTELQSGAALARLAMT
jgi:hypothetical protein